MPSSRPTGHCLCGAVTYRIRGDLRDILHCHCENCRRVSGNFAASSGCPTEELDVAGLESFRWYDLGYARYGFCSACGSSLFWQGAEHREYTSIQVGSLNETEGLELAGVWFADDAQDHQTLDPAVPLFGTNGDLTV